MAITPKQKEIAKRLIEGIKEIDPEVIRENIHEENEYARKQEEAQKPTRKQMQEKFTI